jgi:hypothetical protein
MKQELKKLGTRITAEHKEKLISLCNSNSLNQGEMIQKLIDFYLAKSSLSTDSTNKTSLIQQLELNEIEAKEVENAVVNSGQELKAIARDGLMYRAKYLNTSQTNLEDIPPEELRSSTAKGVAAYKIAKCVEAIIEHNNAAPEKKDKVCLSKTIVQKLSGSNPRTVNKWFEEHQVMIADHNSKHELTQSNNRRGAGFDFYQHLNLEYLKA